MFFIFSTSSDGVCAQQELLDGFKREGIDPQTYYWYTDLVRQTSFSISLRELMCGYCRSASTVRARMVAGAWAWNAICVGSWARITFERCACTPATSEDVNHRCRKQGLIALVFCITLYDVAFDLVVCSNITENDGQAERAGTSPDLECGLTAISKV